MTEQIILGPWRYGRHSPQWRKRKQELGLVEGFDGSKGRETENWNKDTRQALGSTGGIQKNISCE